MASPHKSSIYGTAHAKLSASSAKAKQQKFQVYCPNVIKICLPTTVILNDFTAFFCLYFLVSIYSLLWDSLML